jgi:anti-anti-sigma factor
MRSVADEPDFSVEVAPRPEGGRAAVAVSGEVDLATADEVGRVVRAELRDGPALLDLARVSFMDSSGVRMLDGLMEDCAREGWDLLVGATLADPVAQVLELTGMLSVLPFAGEEAGGGG